MVMDPTTEPRLSLDERTAEHLSHWGQRLSRRGVLARVGDLLLKATGVALIPLLPADRAFAQGGCGDWTLQGMWGSMCAECCGVGASLSSCPPCTVVGAAWSYCCVNNNVCPQERRNITYFDCCGTVDPWWSFQAAGCHGTVCHNHPQEQQVWCGGTGTYRCTVRNVSQAPPC